MSLPGSARFAAAALVLLTGVVRSPAAAGAPRCGKACRAERVSCRSDCLAPRRECAQGSRSDCRDLLTASCNALDMLQTCLDDCAGKPNQDAFNVCAVNCCTKPDIRDPLVVCEEDFDACVAHQVRQCIRGLGGRRALRACLAACRAGATAAPIQPAQAGCYCAGRWRRCRAPLLIELQNCQGGCQDCFDSQGHGAIAANACRAACSDNSNVSDRLGNCDFQRAVCEYTLCHGPPPPTTTTTSTTSTTKTTTSTTTTYTTTT